MFGKVKQRIFEPLGTAGNLRTQGQRPNPGARPVDAGKKSADGDQREKAGVNSGQRKTSQARRKEGANSGASPDAVGARKPRPLMVNGQPAPPGFGKKREEQHAEGVGRPQTVPKETKTRTITKDELKLYLENKNYLDSGVNGSVPLAEKYRDSAAVMTDGTLLLNKVDPNSILIAEVRDSLRRRPWSARRVLYIDLADLRAIYQLDKPEGAVRGESAAMQRRFIAYVERAAKDGASDIHFHVHGDIAKVEYRVDGVIEKIGELDAEQTRQLLQASFNMASEGGSGYKEMAVQDARITAEASAVPLPAQVSGLRLHWNPVANNGRHLACRLLYTSNRSVGDITDIGYANRHLVDFREMRSRPYGTNWIAGPTGSGKSTTLEKNMTQILREANYGIKLLTIEDPPEYTIPEAIQIPVADANTEQERSDKYREAIVAAMRSDPNIIMVGETRDHVAAELVFRAGLTGHGVWTSIHANDAVSIIDRLMTERVKKTHLVDENLVTGLVGQRLVRVLCDHCKIPVKKYLADLQRHGRNNELPELDRRTFDALLSYPEDVTDVVYVANPSGCSKCRQGYTGRTVVAETIVPTIDFMSFVAKEELRGARECWIRDGGVSMREHAVEKMVKGKLDPREMEIQQVGRLVDVTKERWLELVSKGLVT